MYRMRTATPQKNLCQWARSKNISFCCITADEHARKQYMLRHRIDHVHMVIVTVSGHAFVPSWRRKFETEVFLFASRVLDAVM
jgi:hypothetical protein